MFTIAIHGGAGVITRQSITKEEETLFRDGLDDALKTGVSLLEKGGSAMDAVVVTVMALEDNPMFNAGRGSVFNHEAKHEMEASVMWGKTREAGAVCGIRNVRNPVLLARRAMEDSGHLFLHGAGAEEFAREQNLPFEVDSYFFTPKRYDQLMDAKKGSKVRLDHSPDQNFGTVGAVALDKYGNLAAATSTGGLTNKNYGRIGDSPLIGAGTYAANDTCAVSCTGDGEFFIRGVVAYDISCLLEYKGLSLHDACELVILDKMKKLGGTGGVIAIDKIGNVEMVFNCEGMYRGFQKDTGERFVEIWE